MFFIGGPQPWSSWLLNLWKSCVFLLLQKTCPCLAGTIKKDEKSAASRFTCDGSSLRYFCDLKLATFVYLGAYKRTRCFDILWQFSFVRCKVVLEMLNLKNRPDIPGFHVLFCLFKMHPQHVTSPLAPEVKIVIYLVFRLVRPENCRSNDMY